MLRRSSTQVATPGTEPRDLSPEHPVDALGKALATVEIRYLATFRDQAKQIVSW